MQYRIISSISTLPQMLAEADFLIELAEAQPPNGNFHRGTLAGSAAVLLAVGLDQGTLSVLDTAAQTADAIGVATAAARYRDLHQDSLRRRVVLLAEVKSSLQFRLDHRSPHVRALHDLVSLRNDLMHVTEEAGISDFETLSDLVKIQSGLEIPSPLDANPWLSVRLDVVRAFRTAVDLYMNEVLFPPSDVIRSGTVVIPNRNRPTASGKR